MLSPQHNRVQLFKSCARANMIKPMPILVMLYDLSEWCFFKDCPASLIVTSTLPFRKKAMFCTKVLATEPFSSTFMNCLIWFYYWFRRGFYRKSLQPEKKNTIVSPVEPASRTSPAEPARRLRFIDGFKFICLAPSMGNIFTVQI